VADIKKFGSAGKKTAVVSTINGDANVPFYKELGNQRVSARTSRGGVLGRRRRARRIDTKRCSVISPPDYFESIRTRARRFIKKWQAFTNNP